MSSCHLIFSRNLQRSRFSLHLSFQKRNPRRIALRIFSNDISEICLASKKAEVKTSLMRRSNGIGWTAFQVRRSLAQEADVKLQTERVLIIVVVIM